MPLFRKVGNTVLNHLTKISSGYLCVSDPQNGYLAIRAEFLPKLDLDRIQTSRYFFENEMLIQLNRATARVVDCPMPAVYNGSPSSLRISEVIQYYPMMLLRGFLSRILRRSRLYSSRSSRALVEPQQEENVVCCLKQFPKHDNSAYDSHFAFSEVTDSRSPEGINNNTS
jgi:hypothetical protein